MRRQIEPGLQKSLLMKAKREKGARRELQKTTQGGRIVTMLSRMMRCHSSLEVSWNISSSALAIVEKFELSLRKYPNFVDPKIWSQSG